MNCDKRFGQCHRNIKGCVCKIKEIWCCTDPCKNREIKNLGKLLIASGIIAIFVLCFPPVVWFVIMAILMIILGIKIFRM